MNDEDGRTNITDMATISLRALSDGRPADAQALALLANAQQRKAGNILAYLTVDRSTFAVADENVLRGYLGLEPLPAEAGPYAVETASESMTSPRTADADELLDEHADAVA
jgi:hypothetical protein